MEKAMSLREYSNTRGISYESIRKQVIRYKSDLEEHITIQGKTRYLDETAVAFLDRKRDAKVITIMEEEKSQELREEIK